MAKVSAKTPQIRVHIDTGSPKGRIAGLLYAGRVWIIKLRVKRVLNQQLEFTVLSNEQVGSLLLEKQIKHIAGRVRNRRVLILCCAILISFTTMKVGLEAFAHNWTDAAFWSASLALWLYQFDKDVRTLCDLQKQRVELLVESIHRL